MPTNSLKTTAAHYRFSRTDRFTDTQSNVNYTWLEDTSDGHLLLREGSDLAEAFSDSRIADLFNTGRFRYSRDHFLPASAKAAQRSEVDHLSDLSANERSDILWKYTIAEKILLREAAGLTKRTKESLDEALAAIYLEQCDGLENTPTDKGLIVEEKSRKLRGGQPLGAPPRRRYSAKTALRHIKLLETHAFDPRSLRSRHRRSGNRYSRFPAEINQLVDKHAASYVNRNRPTKKACHRSLKAEISGLNTERRVLGVPDLPTPGVKYFRKTINSFDKFQVYAGRYGIDAAQKKFFISCGGLKVSRPLERVEIDEWNVQLMTLVTSAEIWKLLSEEDRRKIARQRFSLCVAIDTATRCVLGMSLSPTAGHENALRTIQMVLTDKSDLSRSVGAKTDWSMFGSPDGIVFDNGAFIHDFIRTAVLDIGSRCEYTPALWPQFRARIERLFSTLNQQFTAFFTGRSFTNPVDRGDYDHAAQATLTVEEFCALIVRFVVDIYHNQPHEGLAGETPANAWKRLTKIFGIPAPPDRHAMRSIFGTEVERLIRSQGIRFHNIHYQCEELQAYRRKHGEVLIPIKIDPMNLGQISAYVDDAWLAVPAIDSEYEGVTLAAWQAACADLRRRFTAEAELSQDIVFQALRDILKMSDDAVRRAGIGSMSPSADELNQAERELTLTIRTAREPAVAVGPSSRFGEEIQPLPVNLPVASASPSSSHSPALPASQAADEQDWEIED